MMIRHVLSFVLTFCVQTTAVPQGTQSSVDAANGRATKAMGDNSEVPLLLRIPAKLIAASVNRDFEHDAPVNQVLLGTNSIGTSHCTGQVTCVVEDNPAGVSILCLIAGSVESNTCGTNGPAIIHSIASTKYVSRKILSFDGKLFASEPASVSSSTQMTITGIESTLPRLRGRIVIRVATARAKESQSQVEAIIKLQTEAELCQRIDADFDMRVADLNRQFASRLAILKFIPGGNKQLQIRSRSDGIELALGHTRLPTLEPQEKQPPIGESVEIWLRRNENLVASGAMTTILITKAPDWLSSYFSETPLFLKPDERKWGVVFGEKWIVLKLHE